MIASSGTEFDPPTFSECVIGYRRWICDVDGQLWPISDRRRAWQLGVNQARCNRAHTRSHGLQWAKRNGRTVLEWLPAHDAPISDCDCGLYSWRRPPVEWYGDRSSSELPNVVGAVASWGAVQVHDAGFRAQYACIVTLAHPDDATSDVLITLQAIASRYRAELTPLSALERVASLYGSPLPDDLRPPAPPEQPAAIHWPPDPPRSAPDATPAELRNPKRGVGFDGRPLPQTGLGFSGSGIAGA